MKKLARLLPLLLLALVLSACGGSQSLNKEDMAHYVPITQDLIMAFKDKDIDTLAAASDDKLAAYFQNPDNLAPTYDITDKDGDFKNFAKVKGYLHKHPETEEDQITILQNVRFDKRTRTFSLTYNTDSKLSGFYAK